jgi:glycosyltransferase involved in cell wall biosynthesis
MIVGVGDDRNWLEQKAKSPGLSEQMIFTGKIPEHEKISHYCLADAYVMPSYGEGLNPASRSARARYSGGRTDRTKRC